MNFGITAATILLGLGLSVALPVKAETLSPAEMRDLTTQACTTDKVLQGDSSLFDTLSDIGLNVSLGNNSATIYCSEGSYRRNTTKNFPFVLEMCNTGKLEGNTFFIAAENPIEINRLADQMLGAIRTNQFTGRWYIVPPTASQLLSQRLVFKHSLAFGRGVMFTCTPN